MVDEPTAAPDADDSAASTASAASASGPVDVLIDDVLVEDVSIDGMCGVY